MKSLEGSIQTVTNLITPDEAGFTLPVEHLLSDSSMNWDPPAEASARDMYFAELSNETIAYSRYYGIKNLAIARLGNVIDAIDEIDLFKQWGGGSIVDTTGSAGGRDPVGLARIARATGINVVMTATVPSENGTDARGRKSKQSMADTIIKEINTGIGGTNIKAGVISSDNGSSRRSANPDTLQACALAHRSTGAPFFIRTTAGSDDPYTALAILDEMGVNLEAVTFTHMGCHPKSVVKDIVDSGCKIALDEFGAGILPVSAYSDGTELHSSSDESLLATIEWLVTEGRSDQILISHSIHSADRYTKQGGHGYFYLFANIIPRMRAMGFGESLIEQLMIENPADALKFRASTKG